MSTISVKLRDQVVADITNSVEAVQNNLVLERQFLISLDYGNFHAADTSRQCKQEIPHETVPEIHTQIMVISATGWESKLCMLLRRCECPIFAEHWVAEKAEGLHFLGAAQEIFAAQHPKPWAAASAAWWEDAQRQLLSSLSILGLEYLAKSEFCFYKPWVYSFQRYKFNCDWG